MHVPSNRMRAISESLDKERSIWRFHRWTMGLDIKRYQAIARANSDERWIELVESRYLRWKRRVKKMGADPQEMLWYDWSHCKCRAAEAEPGYLERIKELEERVASKKQKIAIFKLFHDDISPCACARRETLMYTDIRAWESLEIAATKYQGKIFLSEGTNHRECIDQDGKQNVAREIEREEWVVEITSFEDLVNLLKETGGCLHVETFYHGISFMIYVDCFD